MRLVWLEELNSDREGADAAERPIIWLCHPLGGIIVKRALILSESRKSNKTAHLHSIFVSTYGIHFFGTPHHGSRQADLAAFIEHVLRVLPSKVLDTNPQLLQALGKGSQILQEITDNFQQKIKRFHVYFFWEQRKSDLGYRWDYVGTDTSAAPILDDTDRYGIDADHRNMCKFDSRNSPGYKVVVAALKRYSADAPRTLTRRWDQAREMMRVLRENEAKELLG